MIIFLDKLELCQFIDQKPNIVFNLSSMYSGFKDATGLFTNMKIVNYTTIPMYEYVNTVEFDMQYYNAIFNNDTMFAIFMDIIYADYIGMNAICLVYREFYRDAVLESLMKIMQQRYGLNAWLIESVEDIECLKESHYNPNGIMTLQGDLERYFSLCKMGILENPVVDMRTCVSEFESGVN